MRAAREILEIAVVAREEDMRHAEVGCLEYGVEKLVELADSASRGRFVGIVPRLVGKEVFEGAEIDVARDGALGGPNVGLYRRIQSAWPSIALQASGGVHSAADLEALAATGVAAAISGKALLEKRIRFEEIRPFLPNA